MSGERALTVGFFIKILIQGASNGRGGLLIKNIEHKEKTGSAKTIRRHDIIRRVRRVATSSILPFILVLPFVLYAIISHHVTISRFDAQEQSDRKREIHVFSSMLKDKSQWLSNLLLDYSEWDETYSSTIKQNNKWYDKNITGWVPNHYDVDVVLLTDRMFKPIASHGEASVWLQALNRNHHLTLALQGRHNRGIIKVGNDLYLVATNPVLPNSGLGRPVGTLTFATKVDSAMISAMSSIAECHVALYVDGKLSVAAKMIKPDEFPRNVQKVYTETINTENALVRLSNDRNRIFVSQRLSDWDGNNVAVVTTSNTRDTMLTNSQDALLRSLILIASCLMAALLAALQMRAAILARHAHIDELTGLYNHRYLQERLAQELCRSKRYARPLSIALLDIDHFKHINDEYGHLVGDQALWHLAELLKATVRDTDVVARYGGEEFLVIMPETRLKAAVSVAERLRAKIEEAVFDVKLAGTAGRRSSKMPLTFTVSIGVATYPVHASRTDELLMAADLALFAAKHASRNAVCSYNTISEDQPGRHRKPLTMYLSMREGSLAAVRALAAAIDARDHTMRGHSEKVGLYSLAIGQSLGFSEEEMNSLRTAALLHDVGRIAIPDAILWKPGELTDEERAVVMTHSARGAEILAQAPPLKHVADIVRSHHERFDGNGYPDGIAGDAIPLHSRIICVADAYDAITSDRPYRRASVAADAVKRMKQFAGTQFDPHILNVLDELVQSGELFKLLKSLRSEVDLAA